MAHRSISISLSFSFKQQDRRAGGREQQKTESKITYSPVTLSLFQKENARVQDGRTQWREDTIGGAVKFNLEKHEGFKVRVAAYIERTQFRRGAPWTRCARTARAST